MPEKVWIKHSRDVATAIQKCIRLTSLDSRIKVSAKYTAVQEETD